MWGARWIVKNQPELFAGATEAISEVGGFSIPIDDDRRAYLVATAEKGVAWATLTARGRAAHGSRPTADNAVVRLARAVAAIGGHRFPIVRTACARPASSRPSARTAGWPSQTRIWMPSSRARIRLVADRRDHAQHGVAHGAVRGRQDERDPRRGVRAPRHPHPSRAERGASRRTHRGRRRRSRHRVGPRGRRRSNRLRTPRSSTSSRRPSPRKTRERSSSPTCCRRAPTTSTSPGSASAATASCPSAFPPTSTSSASSTPPTSGSPSMPCTSRLASPSRSCAPPESPLLRHVTARCDMWPTPRMPDPAGVTFPPLLKPPRIGLAT